MTKTVFDLHAIDNSGRDRELAEYRGKVLLIVNTASKCGFTPQYKGLEELNRKYRDQGLVVIGFPCDQFGHQEPGDDAEIKSFCELNFGVSFPLMSKIEVNGNRTHPVFAHLKEQAPGVLGNAIKWNFTKFLVSKDGSNAIRFASDTEPAELSTDIERFLAS